MDKQPPSKQKKHSHRVLIVLLCVAIALLLMNLAAIELFQTEYETHRAVDSMHEVEELNARAQAEREGRLPQKRQTSPYHQAP